jgi:hypothetical protein
MLVSAWLPYSDTLTPAKTVAELQAAGISTAILMVNDFSTTRGPTPFRTFDTTKLVAMADACREAEIVVWLCSWAMQHKVFVDGALAQLPALMKTTRAEMIMWDAEEPWTQPEGATDPTAAVRLAATFGSASMAVTAIGSAPYPVHSLADVCSVWVPQAYATKDSTARASEVVAYSLRWWRERYGEPSGHWMIGLAGYDQAEDCATTMQPPIDDVLAAELFSVCYWTNNSIAARADVCAFVAGLARALPPHPGIMPLVDIAAMPSPTRVQVVAAIQGLLMSWGIDPGPLDGKPGEKTLAGVQAFQRRKLLAPTGVVDANTWAELLRP